MRAAEDRRLRSKAGAQLRPANSVAAVTIEFWGSDEKLTRPGAVTNYPP